MAVAVNRWASARHAVASIVARRSTPATSSSSVSQTKPERPSGHRSASQGHDGCTGGHRLDHDEAEGLGPVDREEESRSICEECGFLRLGDLADEVDLVFLEERADSLLPVLQVVGIDLGRNLERQSGPSRDLDCPVGPLLGGDASDESEVSAVVLGCVEIGAEVKPVVGRAEPVQREIRNRGALEVGDRDERGLGVEREDLADAVEIEPPVHGEQRGRASGGDERQCPDVRVGVDDVELVGAGVDIGKHLQVKVWRDVDEFLTGHSHPQGRGHDGLEPRCGLGLARGEQRDVVSLGGQLVT
jgi:hypothetical protein